MKQTNEKQCRYIVYIYTNKCNDKKYVGMTNQSLKSRRGNSMFSDYRNCTEFYNAIQKYGAEAFEENVVAEFLSLEEAEAMEKKLIAELRTQEEAFGYNLRSGGRDGKHSKKTKERIGKANKGMVISEEHKEQISRANSLKVVCLEHKDGMTILFDSVKHAGKIAAGHPSTISKACKGINKTAGGYEWMYLTEYRKFMNNAVA
ncbi:GIY-YIG nuclease family protein [Clostridium butyricum]|uniref:GIY-YIG nuclease family protein n=1 Tax=Clostridium butyricum TaxID=1492 RepID=UPI0002C991FE|nr:GIY-YIG nuclease family protein [Clostridium butyricum]EMU53255.1 hypothetical protein CBDKU1_27750 [Clostridium butyricum DKU-01]MDU5102552.1 GIY-YIG nuclease family protein [Clostridium butyricum]